MKLDIGGRESASKAARPGLQEWFKVEVELETFGQQAALRGPLREGFEANRPINSDLHEVRVYRGGRPLFRKRWRYNRRRHSWVQAALLAIRKGASRDGRHFVAGTYTFRFMRVPRG